MKKKRKEEPEAAGWQRRVYDIPARCGPGGSRRRGSPPVAESPAAPRTRTITPGLSSSSPLHPPPQVSAPDSTIIIPIDTSPRRLPEHHRGKKGRAHLPSLGFAAAAAFTGPFIVRAPAAPQRPLTPRPPQRTAAWPSSAGGGSGTQRSRSNERQLLGRQERRPKRGQRNRSEGGSERQLRRCPGFRRECTRARRPGAGIRRDQEPQ